MTIKITFSAHALEKLHKELTKLGITENTVTETLKNPDEILYDIQTKRYIAISLKSKIAAIYEKLNDKTLIVTIIYSTKLENIIKRRKRSGRWI